MTKDRRLGRGLAALLGAAFDEATEEALPHEAPPIDVAASEAAIDSGLAPATPTAAAAPTAREETDPPLDDPADRLMRLGVHEIEDNPFQPRRDFSEPEIVSLAESLKEHDMLQPILVRRIEDRYQLISGERRLRAAIQAGWSTVPARLRTADDRLVAELAIVENLQRKDLNPIEKALSFKRYLDEHECTQEDLAGRLKIDRSTIANLLRLLELPDSIREALRNGEVSAGHARALLPLGDEPLQVEFCERIRCEGLSVRAAEQLVKEKIEEEDENILGPHAAKRRKRTRSQQVASLEQELRMALGAKVDIRQSSRERGRIVIHFHSHQEFDRLRGLLTDTAPDALQQRAG